MEFLFYTYVFLVGTFIGSFLNVVIDRVPHKKSIVHGRSHCDNCGEKLKWIDLIPIVSFLVLNGKCRFCRKEISLYYPLVEALTGFWFAVVALIIFGYDTLLLADPRYLVSAFYFLSIISSLIVIFFVDLKYGIIPFSVVAFALIVTLIWYALFPFLQFSPVELPFITVREDYFVNYLLSGIGASLSFFLLFVITKGRGLGFGDVVYVFLMGFILGFPKIILGLYFAFLTGAIISLILVLAGTKKVKGTIPFGPFLVSGTIISLLWGQFIIDKIMFYLFFQ